MGKTIIKEICIMLLLCIAILLILGVIFYDYIPSNKAVPNKLEAYTTSETVKTEISERITELETPEVSYEVTSADLNLYQQKHSYTSGKINPFSTSIIAPENEENDNNTNSENTNTTSGGQNTITDSNSTGTFFNDTGLK